MSTLETLDGNFHTLRSVAAALGCSSTALQGRCGLAQSRGVALPFLLSNGVQEPLHFPICSHGSLHLNSWEVVTQNLQYQ